MNQREYINEVLACIQGRAYLNEIKAELENHIEDRKEYYTNAGYGNEIAEEKAVAHMGSAEDIGEDLNLLYNYKKHAIISIVGLCILIFYCLIQLLIVLFFGEPIFIISNVLFCIIYGSTLRSRGKAVMLLQGIISFGLLFYLLYPYDFVPTNYMQIFIFFSHGIISLTCTSEINSALKGKPNNAMMKRYKVWEKLLYILTAITTFITITGFIK